jgi:hypothetical protein
MKIHYACQHSNAIRPLSIISEGAMWEKLIKRSCRKAINVSETLENNNKENSTYSA